MATYYISKDGSNSNNGLGPDASHATNKPWLTLAKIMHSGSTVVPGDTVWIGPGSLYSTPAITPIAGLTSSASPTSIKGDPTNAQGFKTSGGAVLAPAPVWITTRTATGNEEENTSGTSLLNLNTNANNGFQFYDLNLEAGRGRCAILNAAVAIDLQFHDCNFFCANSTVYTGTGGIAQVANWLFRRCTMFGVQYVLETLGTGTPATADIDVNVRFEDCLLFGGLFIQLGASGGNLAGGVDVDGCTFILGNAANAITSTAIKVSTVTPCTVLNTLMIGGNKFINAGTSGQVIDSGYNRTLVTGSANTNATQAGTTLMNVAPNLILSYLSKYGLRPPGHTFGWNQFASAAQYSSGGTNARTDFLGRTVRPWGAGPSIGAFETPEIAQDTGSAITGGGANSLKITGQGEESFWVPVDASSTTITVITKSTSYGGTNYPQLIVVANPALGVTQQTDSAVAATEETLSVTFTPTAKGGVEVRLISRSTSVSSLTYFDVLA